MTFIAGFQCFNGVALCSDSEECDGYKKTQVNKLFYKNVSGEWGIAIAGAGRGSIIDRYWDRLHPLFDGQNYDRQWVEGIIEESLKQTFKIHRKKDEYFRIGVGMFDAAGKESRLYLSDGHCLAPKDEFFCLGTGDDTLAKCMIETIYDKLTSAEEGVRLGVFVIGLSHGHADCVGGPTVAVVGLNGESTWKRYQPEEIAAIENAIPIPEFESHIQNFWSARNLEVRKTSVFPNLLRDQK